MAGASGQWGFCCSRVDTRHGSHWNWEDRRSEEVCGAHEGMASPAPWQEGPVGTEGLEGKKARGKLLTQ